MIYTGVASFQCSHAADIFQADDDLIHSGCCMADAVKGSVMANVEVPDFVTVCTHWLP
jgi:hypothetical protein